MSFPKKVVTTYAKALFQTGRQNLTTQSLEQAPNLATLISMESQSIQSDIFFIGEELIFLRTLILSSKNFSEFFQNPTYPDQFKFDTLLNIFPGISLPLKGFLKILTERSHLSLLPEISEEYTKTLEIFRNSTTVKIFTASGLKESSGGALLTVLKKLTISKEILLKAFYNPKLLGGLIIEYNSKSIDASILKEFSFFFNEI